MSNSTRQRILSTAERLFAQKGFAATSMRTLTREAEVNLAAVNYHFGSKDDLIQAVLKRRLDGLYRERASALEAARARHGAGALPLDEVLHAFIDPALDSGRSDEQSDFVRLLARAFIELREELRALMSANYGALNRAFFAAFAEHMKHLPEPARYQRIDFMIGALTYAMADFGLSTHYEDGANMADELVRFASAGLTA